MKIVFSKYEINGWKNSKRFALISDIHYYKDTKVKLLQLLEKNIQNSKPDFICIAGDLFDLADVEKKAPMEPFYNFLKKLGLIAPTIIVLGNHDVKLPGWKLPTRMNTVIEKIKEIPNVWVLENEGMECNGVFFMGYEPPYQYYREKEKKSSIVIEDAKHKLQYSKTKPSVLLIHTPTELLERFYEPLELHHYSLILSGHTHNGMMPSWIKFGNFGIISPNKKWLPKRVRGKLVKENTNLIISGGITKLSYVSGAFHKWNFLYASEITIIDLKRE